jgi:hypothetical protein
LPGPLDYEVAIPPVSRAWCRRVASLNIWVLYTFTVDAVVLAYALASPPLPLDRT